MSSVLVYYGVHRLDLSSCQWDRRVLQLICDLLYSNGHSHGDYLCQVSLKSLQYVKIISRRVKYVLTDGQTTHGRPTGRTNRKHKPLVACCWQRRLKIQILWSFWGSWGSVACSAYALYPVLAVVLTKRIIFDSVRNVGSRRISRPAKDGKKTSRKICILTLKMTLKMKTQSGIHTQHFLHSMTNRFGTGTLK